MINKITKIVKIVGRKKLLKEDEINCNSEFYNKAILSYPPRSVTIGITSNCNNKCVFCAYHSDDAKSKSNVYGLPFNLSFDDFKRIIDMCYKGRVPHVHICGTGEPFLHKDILGMIDYCIGIYGKASVQTNFYRKIFDKKDYYGELIKRQKYISYITTDILSGNSKQHEKFKKGSQFEDVIYGMAILNRKTDIRFRIHYILNKLNYMHLKELIDKVVENKINGRIEVVQLHPHNFNEFTSLDSVYLKKDRFITETLQDIVKYGKAKKVSISIPRPFDNGLNKCGSFWLRFQTWPVKGNDLNRYHENVIVGGCNAVVKGELRSLGYIFDYKNIMDLWNNNQFVKVRKNLLSGIYPDKECINCQNYNTNSIQHRNSTGNLVSNLGK